ncbi:probable carboxylesterase 120 [Durio zibethinus]|uniref:Probable carboxylesterase 120 n=1 Tax=Durio zibethinus TaxID=66656 RepID=A0A6P5ZFJ6_DURZI|nr:probable carboxylesterase 120 [Durio zibethinus]
MADAIPLSSISDPYKHLQITLNPDGTLTRFNNSGTTSAQPEFSSDSKTAVLTKDISINKSNNTWARIFLPKQALDMPTSAEKLPVFVYFHGGGFILLSPDETMSHEFCSNMATELSVIIVSASYRLAPEHRLPAAYDDAMEALSWIKTSHENWLENYADYSKIFLMGGSAGGNIAYHLGLRAAEQADNLLPLKIKGLILHQPFFGGVERTGSELRSIEDPLFPPCVSDLMWELSLPIGNDRDHEYCNPTVGNGSTALEKIKRVGWRVFVSGCDGDQLIDRQIELVKMMQKKEIEVVCRIVEGGCHGLEVFNPSKAKALYVVLKNFIFSSI